MLSHKSRLGRAVTLAFMLFAFAGLVSSTAARASSIVYTKGSNIWIADADGSNHYQVTTDENFTYSSPSEDNNGVIAAVQGKYLLERMTQNGQELSSFSPAPDSVNSVPFSPVISPDGSKIAYYYRGVACGDFGCGGLSLTDVSDSSHATDPGVYGHAADNIDPVWVTNSRLMTFNGYKFNVNLFDLGSASSQPWITCDGDPTCSSTNGPTLGHGALSPHHDKAAFVRYETDGTTHLALYNVSGDVTSGSAPPPPSLVCETTDNDPSLSTISFSPDGSQLIYSDAQGVWLMDIPATLNSDGSNCGSITTTVSPIIPGGSEARFGLPDNNPGPRGGKHVCHVPKLIGKKLPAARSALSRANCKLGKVSRRSSRRKNRGRVLSESPPAGAKRSKGTKVNVVIGK